MSIEERLLKLETEVKVLRKLLKFDTDVLYVWEGEEYEAKITVLNNEIVIKITQNEYKILESL